MGCTTNLGGGTGGSGGDCTVIIKTDTFIFNQAVPATTWVIEHSLCKYPSVTVVDSAGTEVSGVVNYVDNNNLTINFNQAFSGKAYLN